MHFCPSTHYPPTSNDTEEKKKEKNSKNNQTISTPGATEQAKDSSA